MEVAREQPPAPQQQQAEEKDSATTQQQQQQQRRKPFQELDLGGDPQKQQQENQHVQKPHQHQQHQQHQQPGVGTMRGAPTPSPRRKSPARKKARTSLENDLGKANLGKQDDQRSDLNIAKTPPEKQANDQKKRAKGELIEFSPDSQGSGPALRFSDSSDESGDDEEEAEIQQHGMNDNADRETQRVVEDDNDNDDDDVDGDSDDMDTSTEDHFVSISAASTPSLPEVELNTRRNALRPVHSERKSAASAGTADLEDLLNSDEDDDSENGHLDDDEANRTVTLAAFQNILAGADDDDEDEDEDAGDRGNEHAGKGQKGVRTRNGTPAKPKKVTSMPFDDSDNDDTPARNGNRRNTASPSALQRLLEMADSEDEDDDEEEQLNAATARGRREAELLAKDDDKLFQVSTPEDSKSSARAQENDDVTPVALRTRSSAKKPPRPDSHARTPGNIAELGPGPTPLKSCISARKKRGTSARQKKKSVVFGSPDAAEFDYQDPVRGGVTPLNKNYARTRYKMEDRVDSDDEDLIEEDRETALNSSILATWEEEEEEDEAMDDDNDELEGSRNSAEQAIQSAGSRRSRSSRGSRRSSMGVFRAGSRKTSEEVLSPSVRSEDDKSELEQKFDAVAAENHRSPPPSPETAEDVLRKGDAVAMRPRTPAQSLGAVAPASSSPDPSLANSNGDTIDFQELYALAASTPGSEGNAANRTVDLDDFDSVLDAHSSGGSRRSSRVARRTSNASAASATSTGTSSGNRTIDLDDLTALAALSPVVAAASPARNTRSQQRRRASEARQQRQALKSHHQADSDDEDHNNNDHDEEAARTVELGQLSELAALDQSTNDSRVDSDVEMEDADEHRPKSPSSSPSKEEHTVELGTLSQLASMSPESASPPSALKQSSLPPPPATEGAEERTVELGNLSDLAAMTPENESVAGRRTRRTSARLAAASSGTKHESTRKGSAATPQDRTVDLGNLSELAAMTPESEPRPNQRRVSGPTASEEKTKELGSLTELAELSPATPATPATPAETKEIAEESQASPTASSPHMRLSFSSLGSSSQGSDKKNERDGKQGLQFDSAAVLNGFMNSPGSTSSSPRSREVTPDKSPALVSARKTSLSPAEATGSASVAAAAAPFSPSPSPSSSPANEAKQSVGPEPTKGMDMTPETPDPANNTNASESAFRPRRALARTPLSAEQGTRDDARTSPDIQEEDLSPPPTPKPTTMRLSLESFLAQCEAPLSNESLHQDLGDAEDPSQDLVDDPEVEAQEVVDKELTRACVLQADMFGQKWTVNESRNRALLAQQTITELVTTLEQSSPTLLQVDAESGRVNLGLKKAIRTLREQALCEARASWSDIEAKGLSLSLQALEEHGSILREDIGIVQEGVQRLEAAGAQASEAVSSAERLHSLLEALLEQREVIGGYKQEIAELEERVRIADKDFTRVQSAHDVQAARLKEAQDNLEALEAQRQAEVDFESQNAVLDVAQGLHIWRLHNASGTSVELALDNVDGSYELITFVFDLQPSVVEIHSQHVGPDALETEDRPQVDVEEALSSLGVEAKMATITKARVAHTVAALRSRLRGAEPSCVPDALLELDVEFGRLHDLWEEISQICQSETYPCKLTARGDGSMVFSVEIYYGGLGAVVKVAFEILPSYPLDADACKVSFELVSERNHDQLLQHLEQAVVQRNDDAKQFAPLSSLWAGILENF